MGPAYDVIGDIHGQAEKLEGLLRSMGYDRTAAGWRHPSRTAVFVGDLIDRGPKQLRTCEIVRDMLLSGSALAAMGNHEFNAIAFHTPDGRGGHLRPRSSKNRHQHQAFLDEAGEDSVLHEVLVQWFMSFPLWLDLPGIRVVHACWHQPLMDSVARDLLPGARMHEDFVDRASQGDSNSLQPDGSQGEASLEFRAVETILKGLEVRLPDGASYRDADGHERFNTRIRWWDADASTYASAALSPDGELGLPNHPLPPGAAIGYESDKPLFIGHYWMTGTPTILAPNVACVDYSAGKGGPLVAYRFDGETELSDASFVSFA